MKLTTYFSLMFSNFSARSEIYSELCYFDAGKSEKGQQILK